MLAVACAVPALRASAADMTKTLHVAQQVAESGFDPQAISDSYSFDICRAIFESSMLSTIRPRDIGGPPCSTRRNSMP